jgi:hypothetical protein
MGIKYITEVAQEVQHLPSNCEATPAPKKKKTKNQKTL